ncbi:hypothetical protein [Muricoccus radiodurans]|uniref:hypothetical protein n=1 Tax=Muricoccus radiodurans TaxID=2231721 RepID=UPI003CF4C96B
MIATPFLRRALLLDAVASGATGALMLLAAGALAGLTDLPPGLLRTAGAALVPYAAFVTWLGTRAEPSRPLVLAVIALNILWTLESVAIIALGWVAPNALGTAFVLVQAAAVGAFAALQAVASRQAVPALA